MTRYIRFDSKEQAKRFVEECDRLGYPSIDSWPGSLGFEDPAVPSRMPDELLHKAKKYAKTGIRESDLDGQHPEFKYLRVKRDQKI